MMLKKLLLLVVSTGSLSLMARDIFLEFKGAYFRPTNCVFKHIYHNGGALFGPELTVQMCEDRNWYGFFSVDYFRKHGNSLGLCTPTTVQLIPIVFGAKYFFDCFECVDLYAGLGFEAMNVRTKDCSTTVQQKISKWGYGGIAKLGAYYYLPCNFLIDLFIDYNFVNAGKDSCNNLICGTQRYKAHINGPIFGAGLGYRF